jgi:GNAT superfamily N-acetyltransferase
MIADVTTNRILIRQYDGDREDLRPLFREADDSEEQIDVYILSGVILVATDGAAIIGHLQLIDLPDNEVELKSMAVLEPWRGTGVGRALVEAALHHSRRLGRLRMLVATATADVGNLRFYQRLGFRMLRVERDAFGPHTGYADEVLIDGIPLRDRVWLDQAL